MAEFQKYSKETPQSVKDGRKQAYEQFIFEQSNNLYEKLQIKASANEFEIKRAFRSLVLQNHPDKGGNNEKFIEIHKVKNLNDKKKKQAYEWLSDPNLREIYDNHGFQTMLMYQQLNNYQQPQTQSTQASTQQNQSISQQSSFQSQSSDEWREFEDSETIQF